jgi:hypothetical protein
MTAPLDAALFLLTTAWGLAFIAYVSWCLGRKATVQSYLWVFGALAIMAISLVLLFNGLAGLDLRYTPVLGMLFAGLFAAGVMSASTRRDYGEVYAFLVLLAVLVYVDQKEVGGFYLWPLIAVHAVSGLAIIVAPAVAAARGTKSLWLTSIGGVLISVVGVALAATDLGWAFLPADLLATLASPLIFLSTALMTTGIMLARGWLGLQTVAPAK